MSKTLVRSFLVVTALSVPAAAFAGTPPAADKSAPAKDEKAPADGDKPAPKKEHHKHAGKPVEKPADDKGAPAPTDKPAAKP